MAQLKLVNVLLTAIQQRDYPSMGNLLFLSQYHTGPENCTYDDVTDELSSECCHCKTHPQFLIHDEAFILKARQLVWKHASQKGQPNLTISMFSVWVKDRFGADIKHKTA